jgi:hypothetical protein
MRQHSGNREICAQGFFNFGALFLALVAEHMEHSAPERFPLFLDLISRCCRCRATLLLTAEDDHMHLVANPSAELLDVCHYGNRDVS